MPLKFGEIMYIFCIFDYLYMCWFKLLLVYLLLFKQTDHTRSSEESDYHEVLQKDDWNLVKSFPRLKMQRKTHSEIKDCKLRLYHLLVG